MSSTTTIVFPAFVETISGSGLRVSETSPLTSCKASTTIVCQFVIVRGVEPDNFFSPNRGLDQSSISRKASSPLSRPVAACSTLPPAIWISPVLLPARSSILMLELAAQWARRTSIALSPPRLPRPSCSLHGPSRAWMAAPNAARSNGFSTNCSAPDDPRSAAIADGTAPPITSARAFGCAACILSRKFVRPAQGGSTSRMKSSGSRLKARFSASVRERATAPKCCGANFFSAELIAAASASYSSRRRILRCGISALADLRRAGTWAIPLNF